MPSIDRGGNDPVLSSDWTGLSPFLIAKFYPVQRAEDGNWYREPNSVVVQAPLTDGHIDQSINWHSPFENQTADAKLSSLSAMLQMGGFSAILNAIQERLTKDSSLYEGLQSLKGGLSTLEGKSAITKLNSTQIFSGMPPMKITATAHFRALADADGEVRKPMDQLMKWALPKKLALTGLSGQLADAKTEKGLRSIYPSDAPQVVGMEYADCQFIPMVFESMPQPLTGSRDSKGRLLHAAITFTLASLTALDKNDWDAVRLFKT